MEKRLFFLFVFCLQFIFAQLAKKPNVILIMADDMGYECLSTYGSTEYETPVLDKLANEGIRFDNCVSQPLCTPSRVKIMTGMYNYRNYEYFGYLGSNQYTFGNMFQDAGYKTMISGKWQLNGLSYKDKIKDWDDSYKPNKLGFDEYCLWQLTKMAKDGERFANPLIEQNGELLPRKENAYGPDILSNYILDFIDRNKDEPFFVYYPMVLVHDPFVPTPDSDDWELKGKRFKNDTAYFKDMVAYSDKIVGKIVSKLEEHNIAENTLLIFTGDNGTHYTIYSNTIERNVKGAKGNTTNGGTHVPMIVSWPEKIRNKESHKGLIEFSDFYATFSEVLGVKNTSDGKSFYNVLTQDNLDTRETAFVHYDPKWGKRVNQFRNHFARTENYKLYQDGKFYNLKNDVLEKEPLLESGLSRKEKKIRNQLKKELQDHPKFK